MFFHNLLWEQSLLAIQAPRFQRDRAVFIAGKPCSHTSFAPTGGLDKPSLSEVIAPAASAIAALPLAPGPAAGSRGPGCSRA